jgi:hypothetical protein
MVAPTVVSALLAQRGRCGGDSAIQRGQRLAQDAVGVLPVRRNIRAPGRGRADQLAVNGQPPDDASNA